MITPLRILMADPEHYRIEYSINPFMTDASGKLNRVDRALAKQQWSQLKKTYEYLGFSVDVLPAVEGLPDLVFTANQSLPFWDHRSQSSKVILSEMRSPQRKPEVKFFEHFYKTQGYEVIPTPAPFCLEGNGDALLDLSEPLIWAGFGPRTDKEVYRFVREVTGYEIQLVELTHPKFYHLDTCFSLLSKDTAAVIPEAVSAQSLARIKDKFRHLIEISVTEGLEFFAGNCHSPNGRDVILQKGTTRFRQDLMDHGFNLYELDTSEFMKSGGSVFCMKMVFY
jgi:N-dimethylarginine dimethylaminohydrolase